MLFIFNTREFSVNGKDLQASTLVGLNPENPVLKPQAVQHLNNRLSMNKLSWTILDKQISTYDHSNLDQLVPGKVSI